MFNIWNKVIRKCSSFFIHKKTEKKSEIASLFKSNSFEFFENETRYIIKNSAYSIELRKGSSDIEVFKQVVINKEYQPIIEYFHINNILPKTIIDCGANIGLTSIQLFLNFPLAKIIAVEPDEMNFKQLKKNTSDFKNIFLKNNAIWSKNEILKIDRTFRDGQDWSIQTVKDTQNGFQEVEAITIYDLMDETQIAEIDFLKIDIEGAEAELFKEEKSYSFLDKTKCIAIEIHDECVDRFKIYETLRNKSFTIINSGELTIGFRN